MPLVRTVMTFSGAMPPASAVTRLTRIMATNAGILALMTSRSMTAIAPAARQSRYAVDMAQAPWTSGVVTRVGARTRMTLESSEAARPWDWPSR